MAGIIELKQVSFSTQNQQIVKDFSFNFEEGKATALVGASGCGKSTVLKLAAGLLVPTAGSASFNGKDIFNMNRQENLNFRKSSAFVFQDSALWANQTLYQILELPLRIHFPKMPQNERRDRIKTALDSVGYKRSLSIRPSQLSMGEQKLIAFARAIICSPSLLFLDEWTESLDEKSAHRLLQLVKEHRKKNQTVIFVSHDFHLMREIADCIVMILNGEFLREVKSSELESDEMLAVFVEDGIRSETENTKLEEQGKK
jgi:ABC-type multidrug transport system ATPase subunit